MQLFYTLPRWETGGRELNWEARKGPGTLMHRKTWVWEGHSPSLSKGWPGHEMVALPTVQQDPGDEPALELGENKVRRAQKRKGTTMPLPWGATQSEALLFLQL